MANEWFYRQPGTGEQGPVTWEALCDLAASGGLGRTALVREGDGAWHVAQSLAELWTGAKTASGTPPTSVAVEEPLETAMSFDDLNLVDESTLPVASSLDDLDLFPASHGHAPGASLDDLGLHVVDESSAPPVRMQRHVSRVLSDQEWTDADAFRIDHAQRGKPKSRNALDLDEDLRDLVDNALTGGASPKSGRQPAKKETPAAAAPSGQYFVRVDGKPHGPIEFLTLRKWAEEGRLIEQDEIQLPGADIWIPASALPMLFKGIESTNGGGKPAAPARSAAPARPAAAAPAPVSPAAAPHSPPTPRPVHTPPSTPRPVHTPPAASSPMPSSSPYVPPSSPVPTPQPRPQLVPPVSTKPKKAKIDRAPSAIGTTISNFFGSLTAGGGESRIGAPVAIGILLVVGLYFAWPYLSFSDGGTGTYEQMVATYAKSLEIREKGGGDWAAFAKTAAAENDERLKELEKTASAKQPALQRMLWASEAMKQVLGGQPKPDSEADVTFREHMAIARGILGPETPPVPGYEGEYQYGIDPEGQTDPEAEEDSGDEEEEEE